MLDSLTIRTLGGIRLIDHMTARPIPRAVELRSKTLRFGRTSSGIYQIRHAPGFADYIRAFDPVPTVASDSFDFEVHDPKRQFLPVADSITLPRDAAPDAASDRVDTPVEIVLPSAPGRAIVSGMTTIRVSVLDQNGDAIRGALVSAVRSGTTEELAWGLTDKLGGAFLPILGVRLLETVDPAAGGSAGGDDEELTTSITTVRLSAIVDPAQPWPANLRTLRAGGGGLRSVTDGSDLDLKAGGSEHRLLTISLS